MPINNIDYDKILFGKYETYHDWLIINYKPDNGDDDSLMETFEDIVQTLHQKYPNLILKFGAFDTEKNSFPKFLVPL